jgi:hypothetical protein
MKLHTALIALSISLAAPAFAETLTLESIITLTSAGIGDEAVIAKIKTSGERYDLSADQMIMLKKKGVSGAVIASMLNAGADKPAKFVALSLDSPDPTVPHSTGVDFYDARTQSPKMVRIDATVSNQAKTGGIIGYALTGGIASLSVKAVIPNASARVKAGRLQQVFYFFFDDSNSDGTRQSGTWLSGTAATVSAPSEFTLIKLLQKQGRREARVGSANIGGVKTGVLDKDQIGFDYAMVRPGVFKVSPRAQLIPGEYGFIYAVNGSAAGGAVTARIFDFAVE